MESMTDIVVEAVLVEAPVLQLALNALDVSAWSRLGLNLSAVINEPRGSLGIGRSRRSCR